jgi:hypothetical protein
MLGLGHIVGGICLCAVFLIAFAAVMFGMNLVEMVWTAVMNRPLPYSNLVTVGVLVVCLILSWLGKN